MQVILIELMSRFSTMKQFIPKLNISCLV